MNSMTSNVLCLVFGPSQLPEKETQQGENREKVEKGCKMNQNERRKTTPRVRKESEDIKVSEKMCVCGTERGDCNSPSPQVRCCYSVSVSHLRVQMRI